MWVFLYCFVYRKKTWLFWPILALMLGFPVYFIVSFDPFAPFHHW